MVNVHARYLHVLEAEGWLDRALEFLPDRQAARRAPGVGPGSHAPEFAVLLAYTKNANVAEIAALGPARRPRCSTASSSTTSRRRCASASPTQIGRHPLRREIIATQLVNQMVNLSGISFDHRMTEETGSRRSST